MTAQTDTADARSLLDRAAEATDHETRMELLAQAQVHAELAVADRCDCLETAVLALTGLVA